MPELAATAWSSAGAVSPTDSPAVSPVPIAERIAAIADAGFCGFGLVADDLRVIRDDIGFGVLRDLISTAGLVHTEIELLERWWIPPGDKGNTYDVRELLFEAADVLGAVVHQDRLGERAARVGSDGTGGAAARARRTGGSTRNTRRHRDDALLGNRDGAHGRRDQSLRQGIRRPACPSTPGTSFAPVPRWPNLRATLRPEMIFGVELDDVAAEVVGTLFEDTVDRRLLCGEGFVRPDQFRSPRPATSASTGRGASRSCSSPTGRRRLIVRSSSPPGRCCRCSDASTTSASCGEPHPPAQPGGHRPTR